jgi:8-oxo-dGTP pyrophosphatase MutT (NUDIX family)
MKRELAEETGLTAREWIPLGCIHPSNSVTDEVATLWLARDLEPGTATPESTEGDMRSALFPFAQAVEMALDGRLTDAITVVALLRARHFLERESPARAQPG